MKKYENIEEYINNISEERISFFKELRKTVKGNIPQGFNEELNYNMIGYVVPKKNYPAGYHADKSLPLPFINLASQKNFIALYHLGLYADKSLLSWFTEEYKKHCTHELDMGKSCIRFKYYDDIPYNLIGKLVSKITVEEWINIYEREIKK